MNKDSCIFSFGFVLAIDGLDISNAIQLTNDSKDALKVWFEQFLDIIIHLQVGVVIVIGKVIRQFHSTIDDVSNISLLQFVSGSCGNATAEE